MTLKALALSLAVASVMGELREMEVCGIVDQTFTMTGGFMINRVISEAATLGFKNTLKVELPSFDTGLGALLETNISIQAAVSIQAQCGPHGVAYDEADFDAVSGVRTDGEWPLRSKCDDSPDVEFARRRRQNWDWEGSDYRRRDARRRGYQRNRFQECWTANELYPCTSINCENFNQPHLSNCSVAVEGLGPNLILLNNQRVGEISPGENGQSWTNCEELCSRYGESNCTELTGDLLTKFGAYDEVSLCGTDITTNGMGIPSGEAIGYEWESPIREFHESDGSGGSVVPTKDLLVGTGTETLEWRTTRAGEDDSYNYTASPYSPLRVKLYGPAEDITARYQGDYCIIYSYECPDPCTVPLPDVPAPSGPSGGSTIGGSSSEESDSESGVSDETGGDSSEAAFTYPEVP